MNLTVYLFAGGAVFFIGIGFIFIGLLTFAIVERRWLTIVATLSSVVGLLLIGLSSTPLPYWLYAVAGLATCVWLVAERLALNRFRVGRKCLRGLVAALWALSAAVEIPHQMMPTLAASGRPKLYVIGDSVTAAMSDRDQQTWPRVLAREHHVEVLDFSRIGATAASAMQQANGLPDGGGLVLLEIGGNDLLGATSARDFERDLTALLAKVCSPDRTVLMFELPLPPFCNEFGHIQRSLAAEYGVVLIPKRVFIGVLSRNGATVDSIHLTPQGHERMAEAVWSVIGSAY